MTDFECPSCGEAHELPATAVGDGGTVVRCPNCSTSFEAYPTGVTVLGSQDNATSGKAGSGGAETSAGGTEAESWPGLTEDQDRKSPTSSAQAAPDLEPGTVLADQYEIKSTLGRGAVATVYRARDQALGDEVALKTIPSFGQAEDALEELAAEYRAQRRIDQRRHLTDFDRPQACKHSGMDWVLLPMEVADTSLRKWLEETESDLSGRLEKGIALLRQACQGLSALHDEGLVHLDLKPENLLLFEHGDAESGWRVKLTDFGLARSLRRGEIINPKAGGEGIGTPRYMAPEQVFAARPQEVGPKADLYAMGVMLFEMLDGARPFEGSSESLRRKHREMDPPEIRTEVPDGLKRLARRCLSKDPDERPATAGRFSRLLSERRSRLGRSKQEHASTKDETSEAEREKRSGETGARKESREVAEETSTTEDQREDGRRADVEELERLRRRETLSEKMSRSLLEGEVEQAKEVLRELDAVSTEESSLVSLLNRVLEEARTEKRTVEEIPTVIEEHVTLASGRHFIDEDIEVQEEGTLIVQPNTQLVFDKERTLVVHGQLRIRGEPDQRVQLEGDRWEVVIAGPKTAGSVLEETVFRGGALVFRETGSVKLDVQNCRFENVEGQGEGGAVRGTEATLNFADCDFENNNAAFGGAASLRACTARFDRCDFSHNSASKGTEASAGGYGGALCLLDDSVVEIEECSFANNVAEQAGGGVAFENARVKIAGNAFTGNQASGPEGGAIYGSAGISRSDLESWGNTFSDNQPSVL